MSGRKTKSAVFPACRPETRHTKYFARLQFYLSFLLYMIPISIITIHLHQSIHCLIDALLCCFLIPVDCFFIIRLHSAAHIHFAQGIRAFPWPCSAAFLYQSKAFFKSVSPGIPWKYISPQRHWASASPVSAAFSARSSSICFSARCKYASSNSASY